MQRKFPRNPQIVALPSGNLTTLGPWEVVRELLLPAPWFLVSISFASHGLYLAALPASFFFFLTGLRQVHDAWHRTLGVPRGACHVIMVVLSVLMLGSMHSVRVTHMLHHRRCLEEDDVEGRSARGSALGAILTGPLFFFMKQAEGWRQGSRRDRSWIAFELLINVGWVVIVSGVLHVSALEYHIAAMAIGQCLFPFFSVWLVHRGCDGSHAIARTERGRLKNLLSCGMLYHVEHHLFPGVPTCRLPRIAERLDRTYPELGRLKVL